MGLRDCCWSKPSMWKLPVLLRAERRDVIQRSHRRSGFAFPAERIHRAHRRLQTGRVSCFPTFVCWRIWDHLSLYVRRCASGVRHQVRYRREHAGADRRGLIEAFTFPFTERGLSSQTFTSSLSIRPLLFPSSSSSSSFSPSHPHFYPRSRLDVG
jgi:hypothetical protein